MSISIIYMNISGSLCILHQTVGALNTLSFVFRDNADGGSNGPETVTFLSPEINQHYTHLVAIDDFEWVNNGQDFFVSGSAIQVSQFLFFSSFFLISNHLLYPIFFCHFTGKKSTPTV